MKTLGLLVLLSFGLLSGPLGCIRSLHPIYTEETLTYDPAFVGAWASEDGDTRLDVSPPADDGADNKKKAYRVVHTDSDGKSATLSGHLAKVGDLLVADLTIHDEKGLPDSDFYRAHLFPLHTFWIVALDQNRLVVRTIDPKWLDEFLTKTPDGVAHYKSGDDIILTAPPPALQKFLATHHKEMLTDEEVFRRVEQPATSNLPGSARPTTPQP